MRVRILWSAVVFVSMGCSGSSGTDAGASGVAFDKPIYVVTLSADASQILSRDIPTVTVTGAAVTSIIGLGLEPTGVCSGVGGGIYFQSSSRFLSATPSEKTISTSAPFTLCSSNVLRPIYPRGNTQITARVNADRTYTATATVRVQ